MPRPLVSQRRWQTESQRGQGGEFWRNLFCSSTVIRVHPTIGWQSAACTNSAKTIFCGTMPRRGKSIFSYLVSNEVTITLKSFFYFVEVRWGRSCISVIASCAFKNRKQKQKTNAGRDVNLNVRFVLGLSLVISGLWLCSVSTVWLTALSVAETLCIPAAERAATLKPK